MARKMRQWRTRQICGNMAWCMRAWRSDGLESPYYALFLSTFVRIFVILKKSFLCLYPTKIIYDSDIKKESGSVP